MEGTVRVVQKISQRAIFCVTIKKLKRFFNAIYPPPRKSDLGSLYPEYKIGQGTYGNPEILRFGNDASLEIGSYTSIAKGVKIFLGGEHNTDWVTTYPFNVIWGKDIHMKDHPKTKGDVIIGNDVWIANNAVLLSGVNIGDGAVIGANSVVAKDVPAFAIVAGNPARIIKYRFDENTIQRLLEIKWWEWDRQRIEQALPALLNNDTNRFLEDAENGLY